MNNELIPIESQPKNGGQRTLYRKPSKGVMGGVFAGLEDYLDIGAIWLRLAFFAVIFLTNVFFIWPVLIYFITWVIIPKAPDESNSSDADGATKAVKYGCFGCLGLSLFTCIIIALLFVVPLCYFSDFKQLFPDTVNSLMAYDDINLDIQYNPNIPMLIVGALLVFVMPIAFVVYNINLKRSGKTPISKLNWTLIVLVWIGGIYMIVNALTS